MHAWAEEARYHAEEARGRLSASSLRYSAARGWRLWWRDASRSGAAGGVAPGRQKQTTTPAVQPATSKAEARSVARAAISPRANTSAPVTRKCAVPLSEGEPSCGEGQSRAEWVVGGHVGAHLLDSAHPNPSAFLMRCAPARPAARAAAKV